MAKASKKNSQHGRITYEKIIALKDENFEKKYSRLLFKFWVASTAVAALFALSLFLGNIVLNQMLPPS